MGSALGRYHEVAFPLSQSAALCGGRFMIADYRDHAAAERTYLAWVRTGIAVIAFGFFIEKFNVFMLTIASSALGDAASRLPVERLTRRLGRYEGLTLIFGGLALLLLATVRFIRTTRLLDDAQAHSTSSVRAELIVSAALILVIGTYAMYLAFD